MKANQKHIATPTVEQLEALYQLPSSPQPAAPDPIPQSGSVEVPDFNQIEFDYEICMIGLNILCEAAAAGDEEAMTSLEEGAEHMREVLRKLKADEARKA